MKEIEELGACEKCKRPYIVPVTNHAYCPRWEIIFNCFSHREVFSRRIRLNLKKISRNLPCLNLNIDLSQILLFALQSNISYNLNIKLLTSKDII